MRPPVSMCAGPSVYVCPDDLQQVKLGSLKLGSSCRLSAIPYSL